MKEMTLIERCDRLDQMISEGRIVRNEWGDGIAHACLLVAIAPECVELDIAPECAEDADSGHGFGDASKCPANILPTWLAVMTPWISDAPSKGAWRGIIRKFASLVRRSGSMTEDAWHRLDYATRAVCVREAMRHTKNKPTLDVCRAVAELCERVAAGDEPRAFRWRVAEAKARDAESAAWTENENSASNSQLRVALAAKAALDRASDAAVEAVDAADQRSDGAGLRAANRIVSGLFAAWEREIEKTGA